MWKELGVPATPHEHELAAAFGQAEAQLAEHFRSLADARVEGDDLLNVVLLYELAEVRGWFGLRFAALAEVQASCDSVNSACHIRRMTRARDSAMALLGWMCLALTLTPGSVFASTRAPQVGEPFPDIALRTLDGEERRVSDFRGTKLVLHVFASW